MNLGRLSGASILKSVTKIFDACGVNGPDGNIPKGSTYKDSDGNLIWPDALTFIEWYALPMMPNFKFILVDNMDFAENLPKKEYNALRKYFEDKYPELDKAGIKNKLAETLECFNSAMRLKSILAVLMISIIYIL